MIVFIQPETAQEQAALLETELLTITVSGDRYVVRKALLSESNSPLITVGTLPFFFYQPVEREELLTQFLHLVEATLAEHRDLIYALYKEVSPGDLSYYIVRETNTPDIQQTILSALYAEPIEELRRHILPVYYNFFPRDQEPLLSELVAINL